MLKLQCSNLCMSVTLRPFLWIHILMMCFFCISHLLFKRFYFKYSIILGHKTPTLLLFVNKILSNPKSPCFLHLADKKVFSNIWTDFHLTCTPFKCYISSIFPMNWCTYMIYAHRYIIALKLDIFNAVRFQLGSGCCELFRFCVIQR